MAHLLKRHLPTTPYPFLTRLVHYPFLTLLVHAYPFLTLHVQPYPHTDPLGYNTTYTHIHRVLSLPTIYLHIHIVCVCVGGLEGHYARRRIASRA
jgi:hypothetical protein